jgi:hypothetical protein
MNNFKRTLKVLKPAIDKLNTVSQVITVIVFILKILDIQISLSIGSYAIAFPVVAMICSFLSIFVPLSVDVIKREILNLDEKEFIEISDAISEISGTNLERQSYRSSARTEPITIILPHA